MIFKLRPETHKAPDLWNWWERRSRQQHVQRPWGWKEAWGVCGATRRSVMGWRSCSGCKGGRGYASRQVMVSRACHLRLWCHNQHRVVWWSGPKNSWSWQAATSWTSQQWTHDFLFFTGAWLYRQVWRTQRPRGVTCRKTAWENLDLGSHIIL